MVWFYLPDLFSALLYGTETLHHQPIILHIEHMSTHCAIAVSDEH
jgi:hypothetical protein